jgi:hypothetical protein
MAGYCTSGYNDYVNLCYVNYYQNARIKQPNKNTHTEIRDSYSGGETLGGSYEIVVRVNTLTEHERDALFHFWNELELFPSKAAMVARVPYVKALIFHDNKIIGSASVIPELFPAMRTQIHRVRMFLDPNHSKSDLPARVVKALFDAYDHAWINKTQPAQPAGMTYFVENCNIINDETFAVNPVNGFWCAGFDGNDNMRRLHWFQGANLGHVKAALGS